MTLNEHLDRADATTRAAWEAIEGPFTGIDKAMGETFFQNFKVNSWKDQNDFTHSGCMQVIKPARSS